MPNLLLVEDEPDVRESTRFAFEMRGFQVAAAASGEEALKRVADFHPQILLIDYKLPGMSGAEFLRTVRNSDLTIPAVMITGFANTEEDIEIEAEKLGISAFLHKPLQIEAVFQAIQEALRRS